MLLLCLILKISLKFTKDKTPNFLFCLINLKKNLNQKVQNSLKKWLQSEQGFFFENPPFF